DGGSDPDATHKASIEVTLTIKDPNYPQTIEIIGGQGVGIVTLPGLPVKPGSWAINPSPKAQIRFALNNLWQQMVGSSLPPMVVEISVPNGCEIAKKTFNPKLGIIGGISILGTQGTVKPYSHAAFKATIAQELDVAKALNIQDIFFSTGRRSENFLKNSYPNQSQHAFIQIADYLAFAFNEAHRREFKRIFLGCFFGKLVKLAQGHGYTHAHDTTLNLASLGQMIPNKNIACQIACAQTAAQALEILQDNQEGKNIIAQIKSLATEVAQDFAQQKVFIELFDFDGQIL
ncbi:MAG: cobalt-precorrin-5B (C(1))-methyltransferase, partial [Desulfovibrionaceae bacterium]|nr:cobalt-precorrin-5B (C(1))-methyltransferase [Desulfovibrionaceae bacterium]